MKNNSSEKLVSLSQNQLYPRMAKPQDFHKTPPAPVEDVTPKMEEQTEMQFAPRTTQDGGLGKSGAGTPSVWGEVKGFKPMKTPSESTNVSFNASVNLDSGMNKDAGSRPLPK